MVSARGTLSVEMARVALQPNEQTIPVDAALSWRFWILVVVTGLGAGLGGGLLMQLLHAVQHFSWSYHTETFVEAVRRSSAARHVLILLAAGLIAGIGSLVVHKLSGGQSGDLSEVIWFHSGKLSPIITLGRATLSIVIVGMGASLGREAALKQTGAAVAAALSKWTRLSAPETRLLCIYGTGAGFAAAYNVPFGGAVFALEVLLGRLTLPLAIPALAASGIAAAASWILLPDRPTYTVPAYSLDVPQIAWGLLAGPLLGLASVFYIRVIAWADTQKPHGWRLVLGPAVVFAALGGVSIAFPLLLGNGKDAVQAAFAGELGIGLLALLPVLKFAATAGCLGSGAPGGLFTPTLAYGSLLGGLLGYGWRLLWPGAPLGSYAIVGGGAVLAATMQAPVSAVILMLELTWRIDPLMVPLLITVAGAAMMTRRLEPRSIYSARIHLGRAAAVERRAGETSFSDLLRRRYDVISAAADFEAVARRLLGMRNSSSTLNVVDERGRPLGVIRARRLAEPASLPLPLEAATAMDMAEPVRTVSSSASRDDVAHLLQATESSELAVVDSEGRLVGVVAGVPTDDALHAPRC